jgi:hypothetical protein
MKDDSPAPAFKPPDRTPERSARAIGGECDVRRKSEHAEIRHRHGECHYFRVQQALFSGKDLIVDHVASPHKKWKMLACENQTLQQTLTYPIPYDSLRAALPIRCISPNFPSFDVYAPNRRYPRLNSRCGAHCRGDVGVRRRMLPIE